MSTQQSTPTPNAEIVAAVAEIVNSEVTGKKWYYSKTFWANIVAAAAVLAQTHYGFIVPAEYQLLALSAINVGLRKISNTEITW